MTSLHENDVDPIVELGITANNRETKYTRQQAQHKAYAKDQQYQTNYAGEEFGYSDDQVFYKVTQLIKKIWVRAVMRVANIITKFGSAVLQLFRFFFNGLAYIIDVDLFTMHRQFIGGGFRF